MTASFMHQATRWDTQPLSVWTAQYADGLTVTLAGRQTHYVVKGTGKPVILIHGSFFDGTLWCHNVDALAESSRVYVLDLWGFGYSAPIAQPSYEQYAEQLAEFMHVMGLERATLIGHSLGGGVAVLFSVKFPERVEKLVLVDCAGLTNPDPFTARLFKLHGVGEILMNLPGDALRKKMLKDFFLYKPKALSPPLFRKLTWFQKIHGTTATALTLMRLGFADKLEETFQRLARLNLPIMIIWGAKDRAIPLVVGQRIHQLLPGSAFFIIQDAGHIPNLEQPIEFNARLKAFLGELPITSASSPGPFDFSGSQHD
jgi:pimeloyl-ACP methyl ester carboxylesterase